jgi:PAS domain S-box-containing protein
MTDSIKQIEELIEQNKSLERRNEELKNIIEVNLAQPGYDVYLASFNDIIDVSEAETLIVKFYQYNKIPTALYDHKGKLIFSVGWKHICRQFHQSNDDTKIMCDESLSTVNKTLDKKPYFLFQCKNGINAIAISIEIQNKHVATIVFSQFFYKDETPDYAFFEQKALQHKFDPKSYITAIKEIPTFSNEEIEHIMQNASFVAEMISYMGAKNLEFKDSSKKQVSNKMLLSTLRDKINEQEKIIKSLLENITKHQKDVEENTVSKSQFQKQLKRLTDRLDRSEIVLNSLLSSIPLGIGFIRSQVFTYVNDQMAKITGYSAKDLIGRDPELLLAYPENYRRLFSENNLMQKTHSIETQIKLKDGKLANVILFTALLNKADPGEGIALSVMDIALIQESSQELIFTKKIY